LVGLPLLAAAISWDDVPSRSAAVDSTIGLASIDSIDFIGSIGSASIDFIGSIGLLSIASIDFAGSIDSASIDFIGSIGLPSIDSIDFVGSIGLASIASIDSPSVTRSLDVGNAFYGGVPYAHGYGGSCYRRVWTRWGWRQRWACY